jgi:methylthioribose-1-phosphate isomerase
MKQTDYFSLKFSGDNLLFLDQTKLPFVEEYVNTDDYNRIALGIERLEMRGAPAIGIAAAYALALSTKKIIPAKLDEAFQAAVTRLARTRPTAVNLFYAIDQIKSAYNSVTDKTKTYEILLKKAEEIHLDDIEKCKRIGENGLKIFKKKSNILTHCNTGKLATGGDGTAFNVIKTGFQKDLVNFVYADETRPLLQGARLTAFELERSGIPFALQSDSSAAALMKQGKVDFVVVGADRIVLNGDTANKIGTYGLAIMAYHHDIPFYVAAPSTTIDKAVLTGDEIQIEIRGKEELLHLNGEKIAPDNYETLLRHLMLLLLI